MKALIRFIHVFLGVSLFLTIGMVAQNYDTYYDLIISQFTSPTIEGNSSPVSEAEAVHAKAPDSQNTSPHPSPTPEVETDANQLDEVPAEALPNSESITEVEIEESGNVDEIAPPTFSYDMEAIDHHSVDHLYKMIEIIDTHLSEEISEVKDLYKELYTRNYMHLEKEISNKNAPVNEYILTTLTPLAEASEIDSDLLDKTLDDVRLVLINLTEVE